MKTVIACTVNGDAHEVLADSRDTLLELLRDRLGLTGTKEGCSNGNCGACTVLVDGEPVNACIVLAAEIGDAEVVTVEGIAPGGKLHPVQQALVEHGGTQCGFCTPGIVVAAKALLDRVARPSAQEIRHALAGNLCRCTGYDKIVEAVAAASLAPRS
ncbi:MAG: (2Fe-2S)-binding protein [Alphaproteobacteria bacterium]|nr:(2Fe-2S)-binding protein [Alphaproteobacteria bacterium]